MNDTALFLAAQETAQRRGRWLERAADTTRSAQSLAEFPRRRCLALARKCETHIVDLAILAELRCEREALGIAVALTAGGAS
ncbi:hypothetical protein [Comamonas sp. NLF-1-9]|uniref:hypothetical protein n=1 Tax=Comamonas sp. NLF-1-9 TaxID=2853163 RepID=UPI001C442617|nr:hypothetical protein [Comamonas sp. NLF-1-9]QXL84112.1 hypothetical protein KUD94_12860 [Comamonas sp. NLF-1-9]